MTRLAYPWRAQLRSFVRAAAGLGSFSPLLAFLTPPAWLTAIIWGACALFMADLMQTAVRQMSRLQLSDAGLTRTGPFPARIDWCALRRFDLKYFPGSRESGRGWMRLTVRGRSGRSISLDSELAGFERVTRAALQAAIANGVPLNVASRSNLDLLGLEPPDEGTQVQVGPNAGLVSA